MDYGSIEYMKKQARWTLKDAIRKSKLRRGPCEVGENCEGRIDGHHVDYRQPLAVRWLCRKHQIAEHRGHTSPGFCHHCNRKMDDYGRYVYCTVKCGLHARNRDANSNGRSSANWGGKGRTYAATL